MVNNNLREVYLEFMYGSEENLTYNSRRDNWES